MCSEKESPNELWVCYLVFVQSWNLSDEGLVLFVHVYTCVFVVVFMYSLFYRFNILVFHRECFHLHRLTTSIFIYKQHFFLVWGGGLNLRNMGIKCLRIEKCVLCAHIRVNLKEPPSKSMIFENAVVQSILHVVMISV